MENNEEIRLKNAESANGKKTQKKNNKKKTIVLIVIVMILVLAVGLEIGFLITNNQDKNTNIVNVTESQVDKTEQVKAGKKIDESKPWVYTKETEKKEFEVFNKKYTTYDTYKVPYINIKSADAEKVNTAINELCKTALAKFGNNEGENVYTISGIDYNFYESKNYVSIVVTESFGYANGSGSTISQHAYCFDLDTLKLIKFDDIIAKKGYKRDDVNKKISNLIEISKKEIADGPDSKNSSVYFDDSFYLDNNENLYVLIANRHTSWDTTVVSYLEYNYEKTDDEQKVINDTQNDKEKKDNNDNKDNNTNNTNNATNASNNAQQNSNTNNASNEKTNDTKIDYSVFSSYKGLTYKNEDYNTTPEGGKQYCKLTFNQEGKPTINIGISSEVHTECYFATENISNLKVDVAAGTTYVEYDFTAWTAGGNTVGSALISFSNVNKFGEITVSAKLKDNEKNMKFDYIKVRPVGQNAVEGFKIENLKNRVYESEKKENDNWYKVEFDESGKPTITWGYSANGTNQINDTIKQFSDVSIDNAAGSAYVTFSYRLLNGTGEKVEGRLRYSNNDDNDKISLRMHNMGTEGDGVTLIRTK